MKTPSETLEALHTSASQTGQSVMNSLPSSNSGNSSNSIIGSSINSISSSNSSSIPSDNTSSSSDPISMITYLVMTFVVIIVLAICGINIFVYLAKGTQSTSDFIDNIFKTIDPYLGNFLSKIVKFFIAIFVVGYEATIGGEAAAEASAGIVGAGLTALKGPELSSSEVNQQQPAQQPTQPTEMTPQMQQYYNEQQQQQNEQQNYEPSTAKTTTGWCYVGEDEGYRSCLEINPSTTSCASGQVYSSQEKCLKN
jgi:hypothetical protein